MPKKIDVPVLDVPEDREPGEFLTDEGLVAYHERAHAAASDDDRPAAARALVAARRSARATRDAAEDAELLAEAGG